jgi:ATP-dependent Lon protease
MKKSASSKFAKKAYTNLKMSKSTKSSKLSKKNSKVGNIMKIKITDFMEIIKKTFISLKKYKNLDIFGANEMNNAMQKLENIYIELEKLNQPIENKVKYDKEQFINKLQEINNDLCILFKTYGTLNMKNLIDICFGNEYINKNISKSNSDKWGLIEKYCHPIGYKIMGWKNNSNVTKKNKTIKKNRIIEDFMIVESSENLDCFDLARTSRSFQTKVYGIKIAFHNEAEKKTMIVCCIIDDINIRCMNYQFIINKMKDIEDNKPKDPDFLTKAFVRFKNCLSLKELLVYNNEELYNRFIGYLNQVHLIKQRTISQIVKDFISSELYNQRTTLIQLLLKADENEFQYLSYLLYDLLSNDNNGTIDTQDQTLLLDSLPWNVKKYFKDAMQKTIQYTKNLSNIDSSKIPLEQQICLLKASDAVKEKAMVKLKEIKAKSEDSGSKARQFLEALLRIPFGIYKEEEILTIMNSNRNIFDDLIDKLNNTEHKVTQFPIKKNYTSVEMKHYLSKIENNYVDEFKSKTIKKIFEKITSFKRNELINAVLIVNTVIKKNNIKMTKISHSGKKMQYMKNKILETIQNFSDNEKFTNDICNKFNISQCFNKSFDNSNIIDIIQKKSTEINHNMEKVNKYIDSIPEVLNKSVYGHEKAKKQVERIIGQWINGEKTGYCFGFEGPPGVGKTSLAKNGIANCLKDAEGNSRPFAFIAIGGSSNGSTLVGHNYTYVGSTWGRIVDILMEKKCMNPIIFIDELDKVSQTEHGKEIIGILTHLIDSTQNDSFNDKYFNGIGLDLSKALFIFSYNDPGIIDRILLDRIHRVRFKHLTLKEKIVITHEYILPELLTKMGLLDVVEFSNECIEYIINQYTREPGVRKLKEVLFEIVGEINIQTLKNSNKNVSLPIQISNDEIKLLYLKDRRPVMYKKIHKKPVVGTINGLWANALGLGGIIPIETKFNPGDKFLDMKLTGLQGDVMKESMNVAKSLAWSLLTNKEQTALSKRVKKNFTQSIHVHCPEGAVPKDGPSAGTAITVTMYSLFSGNKIKNNIAITGEINLNGCVTAIGGLDLKILGGIRAGVDTFIYPKENHKEFTDFWDIYKDDKVVENITFHEVESIHDVLKLVFV